jgi:hypothetical protein
LLELELELTPPLFEPPLLAVAAGAGAAGFGALLAVEVLVLGVDVLVLGAEVLLLGAVVVLLELSPCEAPVSSTPVRPLVA